jgi:CRISPR/Cas system-associated endoribonuclease Cas2
MALYLISYDINHKNENEYPNLWANLEKWGAIKILFSEWVMIADMGKAATIYEELSPAIKKNDRLLVQEIGRDCAWDRLLISDDKFRELVVKYARF